MKIYSLNLNPKSNCGVSEMSNTIVKSIKGVGIENNVNLCFLNGDLRNVLAKWEVAALAPSYHAGQLIKLVISNEVDWDFFEIGVC